MWWKVRVLPTSVPENRQCRIWEISRLIVLMEYVSGIRNSTINIYLEIFQNLLISCFNENHWVVLFKNGLFCPMVVLLLSMTLLSTSINFFTITNYYHTVSCHPDGNYLFKVNNGNTRAIFEICSKLLIKTPERHQWHRHLVSLLLTLFLCFIFGFE